MHMLKKSSFVLVVPCYNEESVISAFLSELDIFRSYFVQQMQGLDLSVVFVDNNSTDRSFELLSKYTSEHLDTELILELKKGYGAALKAGFLHKQADFYGFADLDHTYPLCDFPVLIERLRTQNLDMIVGGRLHSASLIPWTRKLGNLMYSVISRLIFKTELKDTCSGMRVFRHKMRADILSLKQDDLSFSIELTAYAIQKQWRLSEVPILYRERLGASKLSIFSDGWKFLKVLLKVRCFGV